MRNWSVFLSGLGTFADFKTCPSPVRFSKWRAFHLHQQSCPIFHPGGKISMKTFQWRHFNEVFYTPSSPRRWVESALNLDRFFGTFKDSPPGWKGFPPPFFVLSLACWPALEVYFPSLIIISIIIMLTTRCFSPLRWQSGLEKLENVATHNPRELLILSILHQLWFGFSGRSTSRTSSDSNLILVRGEESLEKFPSPDGSVGPPCRGLVDVVVGRN